MEQPAIATAAAVTTAATEPFGIICCSIRSSMHERSRLKRPMDSVGGVCLRMLCVLCVCKWLNRVMHVFTYIESDGCKTIEKSQRKWSLSFSINSDEQCAVIFFFFFFVFFLLQSTVNQILVFSGACARVLCKVCFIAANLIKQNIKSTVTDTDGDGKGDDKRRSVRKKVNVETVK